MKLPKKLIVICSLVLSPTAFAHGPIPVPLIDAPVPPVPGLTDGTDPIVVNKDMAIALGKALFWDTSVGSDGMACGSCHFHAGADRRTKNQINPGHLGSLDSKEEFSILESGAGGPNHDLTLSDFPLTQFNNPLDKADGLSRTTDDTIASSGTFSGVFTGASAFTGTNDECDRSADPIYNVHGTGTRRVEPRNAPTVINAVFNHRNFWDGRANNVFNGSSPWGDRDPDAGVWVKTGRRSVEKQQLHLINSSLASQVVATSLSQLEMVCSNRSIADLGRKLLLRQPLQYQKVHHEDSVFGPLNLTYSSAEEQKPGLNKTYKTMIRQAFASKYWSYRRRGSFGSPAIGGNAYTQMEANFPMFFALSVQLYESTLISDQAPIDTTTRDPDSYFPTGLSEAAVRGIHVFTDSHCNICHAGPALTTAAVASNAALVTATPDAFYGPTHNRRPFGPAAMGRQTIDDARDAFIFSHPNVVNRDKTQAGFDTSTRLLDFGYFNTGVANPDSDPGLAATDDFGNPLSFTDQYISYLQGKSEKVLDNSVNEIYSCLFSNRLAVNLEFDLHSTTLFGLLDEIEPDGNRESPDQIAIRNAQCFHYNGAFIPTVEAAITAFNNDNDKKLLTATKAAFKVPTLRNIELTGPYMHNGSMATLEQVVEFYGRSGNFHTDNLHGLMNIAILGDPEKRADLIAFLKTLTDDRVRYERAPFDHPEIVVPNGHKGDATSVSAGNPLEASLAEEDFLTIPASGANGISSPLQPFESFLAP